MKHCILRRLGVLILCLALALSLLAGVTVYADHEIWTEEPTGWRHRSHLIYERKDGRLCGWGVRGETDPFQFEDVANQQKYYYEPVYWAYRHDPQITSGTDETHFSPHNPCTREQIMTFVWKACGAPAPSSGENPFTDVKPDKYYFDAVVWAVENGITSGVEPTLFGVGQPCTRAQVATFLWNAAGKPEPSVAENPFGDVRQKDYFYKAVLWAVENGITTGTGENAFGPKDTCTRAQVVTFLYSTMTNPSIEVCAHSYQIIESTPAGCTEPAHETKVCTLCGYAVSRSIGAALGHDFRYSETVPCCTQTGYELYTCSRCSMTEKRNEQPAQGHDYVFAETIVPTENSEGYDLYTCQRCGATKKLNIHTKLFNMDAAMSAANQWLVSKGFVIDNSMTPSNSGYDSPATLTHKYLLNNGGDNKLRQKALDWAEMTYNHLVGAYGELPAGCKSRCYITWEEATDTYVIYVFR